MAGKTTFSAREVMVQALRDSGDLDGEPTPTQRVANFFEKGDKPLEIVSTRQWYITNGGRSADLREALVKRGDELTWVPPYMQSRFTNWIEGLNGDWLVSRQRFFGIPFPVWYRLDADGEPDHDDPILASEDELPVDPAAEAPPGFDESQRGQANGFIADPGRPRHLGHVLADSADRHRLGARHRPVRAHVPDGPAAPGPRHHPHLAVQHRRPSAPRVR